MKRTFFILYVRDLDAATGFYTGTLDMEPSLAVPGITEFALSDAAVFALMPEKGIRRLLGDAIPDPATSRGVPRAELYLVVEDPGSYHARAIEAGAVEIRPLSRADWGHHVAYSLDPDGHVLAFAGEPNET